MFFQGLKKKFNENNLISLIFILLILFGLFFNTLSNKTYQNDSWTIGEWLINYQGGFVRRGLIGELIYFVSSSFNLTPIYIIWFLSISAYLTLIALSLKDAKGKVSKIFLLSPGIFLSPLIGDFLIRKDILLLIFFLINLKIIKASKPNFFIFNVVNILGILIHESFAIYSIPIQFFVMNNKINFKYKNLFLLFYFLPTFLALFYCVIFNGDINQSISIHQSWIGLRDLFPFEVLNIELPIGAIGSLGWDFKEVFKLLILSLSDFQGILWTPLAWIFTMFILSGIFLGDSSGKDIQMKFFILCFQLIPILILFLLGWDYGRWIFIWGLSSILIYCNLCEELNSSEFVRICLSKLGKLKQLIYIIEIPDRRKILLFFFAYPHCCWSIYYLPLLLIVPMYSFVKSKRYIMR